MVKRRIALTVLSLILIAAFIIPGALDRVEFEQTTKTYTAAVDLTRVAKFFEKEDIAGILQGYIDAGATTALIHENRGTYPRYLLDIARDAGVNIALIPDLTTWLDADIDRVVREYNVKYIKLQRSTLTPKEQAEGKSASVCGVIDKYNLTLVLTEGGMQLGNVKTLDYEKYIEAADGNILRSFHSYTKTNVDVMDYPAVYYQIYISAYDRNCRFITVKQLEDEGFTDYENAQRTMKNVRLFCDKMESHGFVNEGTVNYNEYGEYFGRHPYIHAATAAMCVLMLALMLDLLLGKSFFVLGVCAALVAFGVSLVMPDALISLYPSLFAAFAPCLSVAVVAAYVHVVRERMNTAWLVVSSVVITLVLFVLSGTVLTALLGGADYFLNFDEFRGVKLSLILPMLFTASLLVASVYEKRTLEDYKHMAREALAKIRWYHIALLVTAAIVAVVYILRSGNVNKISFAETAVRNWLTEVFAARPRTKEMLLGWPCLILYIYFVKNSRSKLLTWIFAMGASTLYASAVNTFCHVFTMAETMYLRLFVGALFGLPIAFVALGVCAAVLKAVSKHKR